MSVSTVCSAGVKSQRGQAVLRGTFTTTTTTAAAAATTGEGEIKYCSEGSRAVPARPSGEALGSEENRRMGCGLLGECSRGKKLSIWGVSFVLGGRHDDEIMIMVGGNLDTS